LEDKELEGIVEECLREHGKEYPNGYGLYYAELRNKVIVRAGDPTLSTERFGGVLNGLMRQGKVVSFGAIRMGLVTLRLNEP